MALFRSHFLVSILGETQLVQRNTRTILSSILHTGFWLFARHVIWTRELVCLKIFSDRMVTSIMLLIGVLKRNLPLGHQRRFLVPCFSYMFNSFPLYKFIIYFHC